MSQFLLKSLTPAREKTKIDEELATVVASDFQSFSLVDDKGFRRLAHPLNPMYAIPGMSYKVELHLSFAKTDCGVQGVQGCIHLYPSCYQCTC